MPTRFRVWGQYGLFTRPEMKVEKVSYDIITPSAARGICDAIFWHPGLRWVIDRIIVCNPIRFTSVRRNEVKAVVNSRAARTVMEGRWLPIHRHPQRDPAAGVAAAAGRVLCDRSPL